MNTQAIRCSLGAISFVITVAVSVQAAELPKLFPDIALGTPVGDAGARNPIRFTEGPKALVGADLNGDGRADAVSGNLDGSISVLLGQPNNVGFQPQILTRATGLLSNSSFRAVVTADFNGDGKIDVAVGDISRQGIVVALGNGDGTLTPYRRKDLGPVRAMATADFDRDGRMDLLAACSPPECDYCDESVQTNAFDRFLCVLKGNGDGTFGNPEYLLTRGVPACFYDVDAPDIDGDGDADAVALDFNYCEDDDDAGMVFRARRIQIFANNGQGTFTTDAPSKVLETAGEGPRAFRVGYLDERISGAVIPASATLDLVVANRDSGTLDIFLGRGGLNFDPPLSISVGNQPRDVAVGDLDRDGYSDLVVVDRANNSIGVMRNLGQGEFADPDIEYPTGTSPRLVALADFNGDGALDAAVNNRISEDISLFIGQAGLAGFLLPRDFYPAGITPVSVEAKDFNHDGKPDVAVASLRSHDIRVRLNEGDGGLGNETIYPVHREPAFIASGDLNGDGHLDLVVTCLGSSPGDLVRRGSLVTLLGQGDGTFGPARPTALGDRCSQPYWLRLGDLDNDGVLDAAIGGLYGELAAFKGRGNGLFDPGVIVALGFSGRPLGICLGDFNRDGTLDIATSRGITVLNDGQFFTPTNGIVAARTKTFNAGTQAWAIETDDLDGDGFLDLMIALTFVRPDPIGVSFGRGDATFTEPVIYEGPDVGVVALTAADMDADGIKDIVVGNRCAATVILLKGMGNRTFTYRQIIRAFSVEDVAVAEMNGDGRPDIIGVGIGLWVLFNGGTNPALILPRQSHIIGAPERTGLFINEIMAENTAAHVTNGLTPDWIEIYNYAALTQSMAGWALEAYNTDGGVSRWNFPGTVTIPPLGHLIVYCEKNSGGSPGLYANFDLSADGEGIALLRADGTREDFVQFPAIPEDASYARFQDGARYFGYNPAPTLGTRNRRSSNVDPLAERRDPYVGPGGSSVGVNARFFDDVALAYAAVCYRVEGSTADWLEITMSDDGKHGDRQPGDGYYGAILPQMSAGTRLEYFLRVIDLEGQSDTSPGDVDDSSELHRVTVPASHPALRITELLAGNNTGLRDERGQYEDWIELQNTGPQPVSLAGLALTKDYSDRTGTWYFPSNRVVQPGERIIVFCDEQTTQGPLHASFKLTRGGDRVYLMNGATWTIQDSLSFGPLPNDTSFGVIGAGVDAQWLAFPTPTGGNLSIPPRRHPGTDPEIFWRFSTNVLSLRWFGDTNNTYRVDYSDDLNGWQRSALAPVHLGESLHHWSTITTTPKRFYRLSPP